MINRTEFTKRFAMLLDRFGRTMSEPGILEYYEILNQELTTEEFTAAAREIHRRDQFWPTPQRFIDAARGGTEKELAGAAWRELMRAARAGQPPKATELSPAERAGLKAIGGFRELNAPTYAQADKLRAAFEEAYLATVREQGGQAMRPALEAPSGPDGDDLAGLFGLPAPGEERP